MAREIALLVIDMLNPYAHDDADVLGESVAAIVPTMAELIDEANDADGVRLIYVNDNYEDFTATRDDIVRRAVEGQRPDLVEPLARGGSRRSSSPGRSPSNASSTPPSTPMSGTFTSASCAMPWRTSIRSSVQRRCG
jgi:nicotinamidase-related amidase